VRITEKIADIKINRFDIKVQDFHKTFTCGTKMTGMLCKNFSNASQTDKK